MSIFFVYATLIDIEVFKDVMLLSELFGDRITFSDVFASKKIVNFFRRMFLFFGDSTFLLTFSFSKQILKKL